MRSFKNLSVNWLVIFLFLSILTFFWSQIYVDYNLVFLPFDFAWRWQHWWQSWRNQPELLTTIYIVLIASWLIAWFQLSKTNYQSILPKITSRSSWQIIKWWLIIMVPLWLGYNALSHDIFNYLFNAKMVLFYQTNPHQITAMEFASDPWVRFMHNIHTPAPYGYGWTAVSLLPLGLSAGIFSLAFLLMKIWSVFGFAIYLLIIWWWFNRLSQNNNAAKWWFLATNPLFVLEVVLNGHNDFWMMWPALLSILLLQLRSKFNWRYGLVAVLLWTFSWNVKLSTILLAPIVLLMLLQPVVNKYRQIKWLGKTNEFLMDHWGDFATLLMILPLFTARSQWFHPWYLIWPLAFWPFVKWSSLRAILLGLMISSLLRYWPWLANNLEYTDQVIWQMRATTWIGALIVFGIWLIRKFFNRLDCNHLQKV